MSRKALLYFIVIGMAGFYLFPVYTMVNTSFKSDEAIKYGPLRPVRELYFGAYQQALASIKRPIWNSMVFTGLATLCSSVIGSLTGYIFAKFKWKGSDILFVLLIIGFYISPQAILIPLVMFIGKIGLFNNILSLVLTHTAYGVPITTLLFKNYYDGIPDELMDSAWIDGCGVSQAYLRIFLPLSLPGFAVVGIFQFTNIWNEFLFGLTLTRGVGSQPVTVAVANLKGTTVAAWNMVCAGSILSILPVVFIYIFLLKLIIKGLMMGSVKG